MSTEKRNISIMFTDIVGYSRMINKNETHALQLLDQHNNIIEPILANYGGRVIKTIGDAYFCEFASSVDTVNAGIEIQNQLKRRNEVSRKEDQVNIRIGIHEGEAIEKDTDLFGHDVNLCARIEPIATPGGIAISNAVLQRVKSDKILTREMGYIKLKNISNPEPIYKVYLNKQDWKSETEQQLRKIQIERGINFVDINEYQIKETESIGILYFQNLGDAESEFFCYNLTENLISDYQKIDSIRTAQFSDIISYKDTQLSKPDIARDLQVDTILSGHLLKSGDDINLSIEMLDTNSGDIIWSKKWKTTIVNIKQIRGEIVKQTAHLFDVEISNQLSKSFETKLSENPKALECYSKAKYLFDIQRSKDDLKEMEDLFKKAIELDSDFSDAHAQLAMVHHRMGHFEEAEEGLETALDIAEGHDNKQGIASVYNCLGIVFKDLGQYPKAIRYYEKSLKMQIKLDDKYAEAKTLNNLASCYTLTEPTKALEYHQRSLKIKEELEEEKAIAITDAGMSNVYHSFGDYSQSIVHAQKALGKFRSQKMRNFEGRVLMIIAENYIELGLFEDAENYLVEAHPILEEFNQPFLLGKYHMLNSLVQLYEEEYSDAIDEYDESIDYFQIAEQRVFVMKAMQALSIVYIQKEKYRKARKIIEKVKKLSKKLNIVEENILPELTSLYVESKTETIENDAILSLRKRLEEIPNNKNPFLEWWMMAKIYFSIENSDEAKICQDIAKNIMLNRSKAISNSDHAKNFLSNNVHSTIIQNID
ncbi:MAG: tetratricopeptide repeat protein [Candidatus Marinimicrobia bacterium]|nr:tetratricopeptide repeat protein [Candidatus Neomarinimicrobiota bacterium]MBL7110129.1 tetratricopeptide repeat protein [Candidatus Neomarinimicrobiota bacterium]